MWVLPSLGRPERAHSVAQVARDTRVVLRLHKGDPELKRYMNKSWPNRWRIEVGPNLPLARTLNQMLVKYPRERQYGFLADDTFPTPSSWSQRLSTVAGKGFIAYPDDGIHGEKLCTHHCIGGDLMREVGWWCLPGLNHSFFDTVWWIIGSESGNLRYCPEVRFEHRHFFKGGEMDSTYEKGQSFFDSDKRVFDKWRERTKIEVRDEPRP